MNALRLTAFLTLMCLAVAPASASEVRTGNSVTVPQGAVIDDELFASAGNIDIRGRVSDDLLAWAGRISITGQVGRSATIAGGNIEVAGTVGGNLRAAGGDIRVSGPVLGNASMAGGTITIAESASVGRDMQIAGGDVRIEGKIGRNLRANGAQVYLNGEVGGDARVNAGQLSLGPKALIRGDLVYTSSQRASIASGARVLGRKIPVPVPERPKRFPVLGGFLWLLSLLAVFVLGVIMIALAPKALETTADRVIRAPGMSLLIGFILLIVVPVAVAIAAMTLIGIPVGLILLAGYLIALFVSRIFVGLAMGRWIFARFGKPQTSLYLDLLVGIVILWLLWKVPVVGPLIHIVAVLLGLGVLIHGRYMLLCQLRSEGRL